MELLRILAMFMIVSIHANRYLFQIVSGRSAVFFNGMVNGICNIGVTCFILISGYYGMKPDVRKFVRMECMMVTYSLAETILLCIVTPQQMQGGALLEQLVKSFFPFITRKYWFYSSYVCLLFFSGYIQKFLEQLTREAFQRLLLLQLVLFSVLPTLFYFELVPDNGKGLVQMIMIYMVGRYIRMYQDVNIPKGAGLLFLFLWIVNGVSHEIPIQIGGIYHHLCKDNSFTNLTMAVILFYLVKGWKFRSSAVNRAAGDVFAAFALNNALVTVVMELLLDNGFRGGKGIVGYLMLIGIEAAVFAGCLFVGEVRRLLFDRCDNYLGDLIQNRVLRNIRVNRKQGGKGA
ncbi:MAG: acyltransferase [Bacteroidales bacterium]|nr:acyltransferase [Bacteroidales bacterium]MCM1416208.1 acyltransferase [bacterium]MCM1424220.1 acyltransferase [bacterium]